MKTPPNSIEAERAVLGSILLDTTGRDERVMDVCQSAGVVPDTFFDPRNRAIYSEMQKMARESKPLDALTLTEEMTRGNMLEAVGGAAYIQSLIDQTPTTAHAEYYINIILGKHLRRTMIDSATKTIEKCFDEGEYPNAQAVLGDAEKSFLEIGVRGDATMPWSDAVDLSFQRIDAMFDSNGRTLEGMSTGLTHLDEKLQGLKNLSCLSCHQLLVNPQKRLTLSTINQDVLSFCIHFNMSRKTCTTGTDNTGFSDNINKVFFHFTHLLDYFILM